MSSKKKTRALPPGFLQTTYKPAMKNLLYFIKGRYKNTTYFNISKFFLVFLVWFFRKFLKFSRLQGIFFNYPVYLPFCIVYKHVGLVIGVAFIVQGIVSEH